MWLQTPQTTLVRVLFVYKIICARSLCVYVKLKGPAYVCTYSSNFAHVLVCVWEKFPDNTTIPTFTLYRNDSLFLAEVKNTRSP